MFMTDKIRSVCHDRCLYPYVYTYNHPLYKDLIHPSTLIHEPSGAAKVPPRQRTWSAHSAFSGKTVEADR